MKFKITHSTAYTFDTAVFLEPHYLRFRPRETPYLKVVNYSLSVNQQEAAHKIVRDEENTIVDFYWFTGTTQHLKIVAQSTIILTDFNPFDFIIEPQRFNIFPFNYDVSQQLLLAPSLVLVSLCEDVLQFTNKIAVTAIHKTIPFITKLTQQIHQEIKVAYREEGPPLDPDTTFKLKRGSCRDVSWLLIHMLRHKGFATRFVSGYYYFEMETPSYELHAWVDVFIPGIGWLGLDPSHGILTGNTHFPIASSAHYWATMPVSGTIRGSASTQLKTDLHIERL